MNQQTISCRCSMSIMSLILAVALVASNVGCAMMNSSRPSVEPPDGLARGPSYKVIFGTAKGKTPTIFNGQITGNITIQQALEASGATKKFKGMRVDVARRLESGQILKMPVHYDYETGRVMEEQNYTVHPGDEILVRENNPGMLESVFKDLQGPRI